MALVIGTPPNNYVHPFGTVGMVRGFPNESWHWNHEVLNMMTDDELLKLYNNIKEFNGKPKV